MQVKDYFKKFYNMEPYLTIGESEWRHIMETYEKEEAVEALAEVLVTYPAPVPEITDKQTLDSLNKLKGVRWNDILVEGNWFPRNERKSKYDLTFNDSQYFFKKSNTGNNASNPFHVENRWKVDWTRTPSGWKTWQTVNGIKTIVRAYWTLEKVLLRVDLNTLRMATTLRKYVASQFKPAIAKSFYDYFKSENILDFSAGWGDRLAGFYTAETTKHYVGVDPNTNNHPNYERQVEFYRKYQTFFEQDREVDLIDQPAEDVDYSKYENFFDTIFTSPPYFNTEKYTEDDTQSWVRYKKIDDWNVKFLHTTLEKLIPTLKSEGILAVNIADVFNAPINDYVDITNPMNDFLQSKGLKYRGCIGMEMTKRFNSGGAGNAKSEYFSEDLKEITEETKDVAFAEPIWIWERD
jgi:DNA modification methylase